MGTATNDSVAVVIPAYNAGATLSRTVRSALSQTHENLQIVIVDDGSTDNTAEVAQVLVRSDPRVRLLQTPNRGVASARNFGAQHATAPFLAPLDADDLWHPKKVEMQLAALQAAGPQATFAYCGFRFVDADDRVTATEPLYLVEGWAQVRHAIYNFVGTGSTPLIRRDAFDQVGGYDARLREMGLQGCEDYLLQARLTALGPVAGVDAWLVGYRTGGLRMSASIERMLDSRVAATRILTSEVPGYPQDYARAGLALSMLRNGVRLMIRGKVVRGGGYLARGVREATASQQALAGRLFFGWIKAASARPARHRPARSFENFAEREFTEDRGDDFLRSTLNLLAQSEVAEQLTAVARADGEVAQALRHRESGGGSRVR